MLGEPPPDVRDDDDIIIRANDDVGGPSSTSGDPLFAATPGCFPIGGGTNGYFINVDAQLCEQYRPDGLHVPLQLELRPTPYVMAGKKSSCKRRKLHPSTDERARLHQANAKVHREYIERILPTFERLSALWPRAVDRPGSPGAVMCVVGDDDDGDEDGGGGCSQRDACGAASLALAIAGSLSRDGVGVVPRALPFDVLAFHELSKSMQRFSHPSDAPRRALDARDVCESTLFDALVSNRDERLDAEIGAFGETFVMPAGSQFAMCGLEGIGALFSAPHPTTWNLIVADPPWENRSVQRSKAYATLPPHAIKSMPVRKLAAKDAVIAVWVTNNPAVHAFVRNNLLPAWGFKAAATWFWLKLSATGLPVVPFHSSHRKPYEPIIIGVRGKYAAAHRVPSHRVLCSIANVQARKPLLEPRMFNVFGRTDEEIASHVRPLELFGRNLRARWTSWGNEVLKFQQSGCFHPQQREMDAKEGQ